jgi:hypothetical protein
MQFRKRPVEPYVVEMSEDELTSYHRLRIPAGH